MVIYVEGMIIISTHIWHFCTFDINRIKTYRFGLSIDIGHDGVRSYVTIRAKYAPVFNFWVKYQDTWSLPNNFCSINSRRFLLTAVNWLMRAIVVGYSACTIYRLGTHFLTDQHTVETCCHLMLTGLQHSGLKCFNNALIYQIIPCNVWIWVLRWV